MFDHLNQKQTSLKYTTSQINACIICVLLFISTVLQNTRNFGTLKILTQVFYYVLKKMTDVTITMTQLPLVIPASITIVITTFVMS